MTEKPHVQKNALRLNSLLKFRMKMLIAGVLGGGTMIAFPVASAAVVIYVALALGTIGLLAWTGVMALAPVVVAALIVPALTVMAVLAAVDGVLWLKRMGSPRSGDIEDLNKQQAPAGCTGCDEGAGVLQEGLDDWETDGGTAAPARRRVARRRVRRSHRRRPRAGPDVGTSEGGRVLTIRGDHRAKPR